MIGRVIAYAKDAKAGVILTDAGAHVMFHRSDWLSVPEPEREMDVHFTLQEKHAVNVSIVRRDELTALSVTLN